LATTTTPSPRAPSPRPAATTPIKRLSMADITGKGSGLPNRYILHAIEGWGKTSFGAQCPKPIFLQTGGETGLETLIDAGRLPEIPHAPAAQNWDEVLAVVEFLRTEDHGFKTLVIDTINGAEALMHRHVCDRDYKGEWNEHGFLSYNKGYEVSLKDWIGFLNALDGLRAERKMTIFALCHTKVKPFKNPEGPDFDRYQPDMHEKTWGLSHKWSDCVLFGNFEITVQTDKPEAKRGKGTGGNFRMLYTERHAAYDAKNRLGLPSEIEMGNSPQEAWAAFTAALKAGKGVQ
jgi:hypothetical protein